jgi:hypothetical protein
VSVEPPIEVTVSVHAVARCPACGKSIRAARTLSETELDFALSNVVELTRELVRGAVFADIRRRGWTKVCGSCRDKETT